jgi:hypothetical protein
MQQAKPSRDEIALLSRSFQFIKECFSMKTEKLVQFAMKQAVIIVAVSFSVPVVGIIATLLLMTVANLFGEQLHGLMILSVVATSTFLAIKTFRRDTSR